MGSEKSMRSGGGGGGGGFHHPSLFPLFEGQLKQNLVVCNYVTNYTKNHNKIDDIITGPL